MSKCRAKNPGRCRVHGSNSAVSVLLDDRRALDNVKASKELLDKALKEANDPEEFFEATQLHNHDVKAYNATLEGMKKLSLSIMIPGKLNNDEKMEANIKLMEAKEYRKEVLANDPVYQESVQKYTDFTKENGVKTISLNSKEEREKAIEQLAGIEHMTPLAIKTHNGYIYTYAGNGYSKKPSKLNKLFFKPGFLLHEKGQNINTSTISLSSSKIRVYIKDLEEITVLKPGSFDNGFDKLENVHASSTSHEKAPHYSNSRWSIKGKEFYAEIEAKVETRNDGEVEYWNSGHASFEFKDTTAIKHIPPAT